MLALVALISSIVTYLLVNFGAVYIRNQKAFKFFASKCPQLPTVPNPSPFSGHHSKVIMTDKSWQVITELHEKYGKSFGFYSVEQPWVATKDLDLIKLVEVDEAKKHPNRPFFGIPLKNFNNSILQIHGEDWRAIRQVMAPALTNLAVKGNDVSSKVEYVTREFADSLERRLKNNLVEGKGYVELEMRDMMERYTLAVIFLVSYNQADMVDFDAEQDKWTQLFAAGAKDGSSLLVRASVRFPFMRPVLTFLSRFGPLGTWERSIERYIQDEVDKERKAREQANYTNSKRTLLDTAIDGLIAKKYKYDHFMGSLVFLTMAGQITTADTLTCLTWQLAMNPDIQERLRRSIKEDGLSSEYLSWCVNETIRWHPAVPLVSGRVLGEDVEVNGQFYAKGIFVMPSTHSIHHDPEIWPEPERFNPDRWRDQANFHPAQFHGFGLGPRNCVGGKLAVHEIKLAIQMLLNSYRIEVCDGTPSEWRFRVPTVLYTIMESPVVIRFSPLAVNQAHRA